jgi:hypothetical protein
MIGMWSPAERDEGAGGSVHVLVRRTKNAETAAFWRAELSAGRRADALKQASASISYTAVVVCWNCDRRRQAQALTSH